MQKAPPLKKPRLAASLPGTGDPSELATRYYPHTFCQVPTQEVCGYNGAMRHIGANLKWAAGKVRITERGEMMEYFCKELNRTRIRDGLPKLTMGRMGKKLEGVPTKDLYYLKRVCSDAKDFSKRFWWELDPKKHAE